MSNIACDPRYDEYKEEAFEMSVPDLKEELEKISFEENPPRSRGDAEEREIQQAAYRDALNERVVDEDEKRMMYPGSVPTDTPSLEDKHGHGPIPPK